MGVNSTGENAVAGHLVYSDGFTNGDPQAGKGPTVLEANWYNSVTAEINYAIAAGDITPTFGTSVSAWSQLADSIAVQDRHYKPRGGTTGTSYKGNFSIAAVADWRKWERTADAYNVADNTIQTLCTMLDIPNESQFWLMYHACVVQTDSLTTYNNVVLRVSGRKSGGAVTIQKTTTVDTDGALGVSWSAVNNLGGPALRATLPVAVGKLFNIFAHGSLYNVIRNS